MNQRGLSQADQVLSSEKIHLLVFYHSGGHGKHAVHNRGDKATHRVLLQDLLHHYLQVSILRVLLITFELLIGVSIVAIFES